jgi:hypothetical protein
MIALVLLAVSSVQAGQSLPSAGAIKQLRLDREWLFSQTHKRNGSGYWDWGESSPDGILFPIGRGDRLFYCAYVPRKKPNDDRFVVTCWFRKGNRVTREWQFWLRPGKDNFKATGTLLRHACSFSVSWSEGRTRKNSDQIAWIHHKWDGFHPVRNSAEWQKAKTELEKRQPLVHYHFNWHGDASLGNYVDVHDENDKASETEQLELIGLWPPMTIPSAEIERMANLKPPSWIRSPWPEADHRAL